MLLAALAAFAGPAWAATISGTVFEDTTGDLLADGGVGTVVNPGISGLTVRLFNSTGSQVSTTVTDATGAYSFTSAADSTFYVVVDAPTRTAGGTIGVLGEQAYASAGVGNFGPSGGGGYGVLCVYGTPPTYNQQGAVTTAGIAQNPANGSCYGGRRGNVADSGTTVLNNREHVVRVVVDALAGNPVVTNVDFGFSFNAVTNVNDSGQGSLRQFIVNANAIPGDNAMRFVPAVATNSAGGGGTWWQVVLGSNLPAIAAGNGAATTIDGTAYSDVDGAAVLDFNPGNLRAAATVGYLADQTTIAAIAKPELQINRNAVSTASWVYPVLTVQAANVTVRKVSVTYGTESILVNTGGTTNLLVEDNALGMRPDGADGYPSTWNGGSDSGTSLYIQNTAAGYCTAMISTGTARRNVMVAPSPNVRLCGNGVVYTVSSNFSIRPVSHPVSTAGTSLVIWGDVLTQPQTCVSGSTAINNYVEARVIAWASCGSGNQVIGNTIASSAGIWGVFATDATDLLIRGNDITNGTSLAPGVNIRYLNAGGSQRIQVTRNSFHGNGGNGIDLNNNGVTIATATGGNCPSSGNANGGLPRPSIASATLSGATTLNVSGAYCNAGTYTLEFYKVAAGNTGDVGSDTLQAGEGQVYLGALTGLSGGTFSNATLTFAAGTVAAGDGVTAIAIREDGAATAGNTSEFSANALVSEAITGTVFEDMVGDLLADGAVGGGANPGINGATVRLYNSAGTQVASTTTATGTGTGQFTLLAPGAGTFYLAVDAPTATAAGTAGVLLEQTYATAGAGNGGTAGGAAGYGSLCVQGVPPTYTAQAAASFATNIAGNPTNGACYGGQSGAVADSGTALTTKQHVVRLIVTSGAPITGVDLGFSANVATNVNDAGQGSVRQFIVNANAIPGGNAMRFAPAVATNGAGGGGNWWKITLATKLPVITGVNGAGTTLDGTAYSDVDGTSVFDANPGNLENALSVGYLADQTTLAPLARPELEINLATGGAQVANAIVEVAASNATIQKLSITGGGDSLLMRTANITGLLVLDNALGVDPNGVDRVPVNTSAASNVLLGVTGAAACSGIAGTKGLIDHNLMRASTTNIRLCNLVGLALGDWVVQNNFVRGSVVAGNAAINLAPAGTNPVGLTTSNVTLQHNLVTGAQGKGISFNPANSGSGHQVIGNAVTGNTGVGIGLSTTGGKNLVRGNVVTNNTGAGVMVDAATVQNTITQNSLGGNGNNAIDLNGNGVTIVTATGGNCPLSGTANGGLPRPAIVSATATGATTLNLSGTYCNTGTYTLEFYKVAAGNTGDVGSDTLQAGEGQIYLGSLTGLSGGAFSNTTLTIASGAVVSGDRITAIAIRTDGATTAGNTSEFSANAAVGNMVGGRVFEDVVGDLLTDGALGSAGNPVLTGATVRLFNSIGSQTQATTTDASGVYAFLGITDGTWYIVADPPVANAGGTAGVLGEQTYATSGTGNGGAVGTDFGPLCVMGTPPVYTDQGATTTTNTSVDNAATGACYGGRRGSVVDSGTTTLNNKEHVIRVSVAGGNVTEVDFGFSFNVVTHVNNSGQGSVRQFITNANVIPGANAMRFVPAVVANGTGALWWKTTLASLLPAITGANGASTTLDGTAYSDADGTSVLDTNPGNLENALSVGYLADQATLAALARPELEISAPTGGAVAASGGVVEVAANNATIKKLSLTGGQNSVLMRTSGVSGLLVQDNALGVNPSGTDALPSGTEATSVMVGVTGNSTCPGFTGTTGLIDHNLMRSSMGNVLLCSLTGTNLGDWVVQNNFMRGNTGGRPLFDTGAWATIVTPNLIVQHNLVTGGANAGIVFSGTIGGGGHQVIGNTSTANGRAGVVLRAAGGNTLVRGNVLTASTNQPGLHISSIANSQNRITQNQFGGNTGNAIDLANNGVSLNTDACTAAGTGGFNGDLARPTITIAALSGTTLMLSGSYCGTGTYTLEFYKVAAGNMGDVGSDTLQAGEGEVYLGALAGQSGGVVSGVPLSVPGTLAVGDRITAIAIREDGAATAGNTSEFSANVTVTPPIPILTLTKVSEGGTGTFVFNGAVPNANGFPSDSSYVVTTTAVGTPAAGTAVSLAAGNVVTDIREALPAGWVLSSVSCTDAAAAVSGNPTGTFVPQIINGDTIRIAAEYIRPAGDLRCTVTDTFGLSLTGQVILDDGAGGGIAHDATRNGGEVGRAGVTVRLTDCAATTYASTVTDANGDFALPITGLTAGATVCLVKSPTAGFLAVSANAGATAGSYDRATDTLTFVLAANTSYAGIVLGEVTQSRLTTDGAQQVPPGGMATYAHTFVAGSPASLTFATVNTPNPADLNWTSLLYLDVNCDALLDGGDSLLVDPITVTTGQTVCLLNRVTSPAGAVDGMVDVTTVSASEILTPEPTLGPLTFSHARTDVTTVGQAGLVLIKQVRKVVVCPADAAASAADVTPWTTSNSALPGELLEYRILYHNNTSAPVRQMKVDDTVPAHTLFRSALCLELPAIGIAGCAVSTMPNVGDASGGVEWVLTDAIGASVGLQPGAQGGVGYCVQVEP